MNRLIGSYSMLPEISVEATVSSACNPTRDRVEAVFLRCKEAARSGQSSILDKFGATGGCQHASECHKALNA
jgi:hypothetical protein